MHTLDIAYSCPMFNRSIKTCPENELLTTETLPTKLINYL